jgi:antitoxin HicB
MWTYTLKLTKDDNRTYLVTAPDFPEVTTFGKTVDDARSHGRDAIEEAIGARMAERTPIPAPSTGRYQVALPTQAVAKILLYRAMQSKSMSKNELARRLHWHRPQVDRLLNLRHGTRLDAIEQAFGALDLDIKLKVAARPRT